MLSALYGKRFDCHGLIEGAGIFYVPDLATYSRASGPGLPFNSHAARTSFPVKLALSEAKSVENWLFPSLDDARTRQIQTACVQNPVTLHHDSGDIAPRFWRHCTTILVALHHDSGGIAPRSGRLRHCVVAALSGLERWSRPFLARRFGG